MVHKHEKGSGSVAKRLLGLCLALVMLCGVFVPTFASVAGGEDQPIGTEQVTVGGTDEKQTTDGQQIGGEEQNTPADTENNGGTENVSGNDGNADAAKDGEGDADTTGDAAANETFTVTLEAVDEGAPMPDTATIQVPAVATDNKTASGEFKIHYTVPGVYHYKITQTAGNAAYTSYDKTVYYVTVSVFYNENGDLDCEVAARKNDPNTTAKAGAIEFFNSYSRPGHRVPTTNPTTPGTLIQTGQLNWPVPVLAGLGAALIALGCVLLRKRRNGRHA